MARSAQVTLGGRVFDARRLPVGRIGAWRRQAEALVGRLPALMRRYEAEAADQAGVIEGVLGMYAETGDLAEEMVEAVLAAIPEAAAARAELLEAADEDEFLEGLTTLLLLNAPLAGAAAGMARPPSPIQGETSGAGAA